MSLARTNEADTKDYMLLRCKSTSLRQTEMVLKLCREAGRQPQVFPKRSDTHMLKPSPAVLMTVPGIWGCQWISLTSR